MLAQVSENKELSAVFADTYGVAVNPAKSEKVAFAAADRIIVLAEE